MLDCKPGGGRMIPHDAVARVVKEIGPQTITHFGQLPAATLSFNLKPGGSLGDVVSQIRTIAQEKRPDTVGTSFQCAAKAFQTSLTNMMVLLIVIIIGVYIILEILYKSYILPLTILSCLHSP